MNKGPQAKTTEKYVCYVVELISKHNLDNYEGVNLKDNELLEKYFKGNSKSLNSAYSYMINSLLNMGIIKQDDSYFIPKVKARTYTIDIDCIADYMKAQPTNNLDLYYMLFPDFNPAKDKVYEFDEKNCISITTPTSYGYSGVSQYNGIKVENLVWAINPIDMNSKRIVKANYSQLEIDNACILIAENIRNNNPLYAKCFELCQEIARNTDNKPEIMLNVKVSEAEKQPTIKASCRQFNRVCKWSKGTKRALYMKGFNYDLDFDLHSTIFAITRLLNTGEFDADWDLKKEILDDYDLAAEFEQDELKNILNRCFFNKSAGQAWSQYNRSYWKRKKPTPVSEEVFKAIFKEVQYQIGGSEPYIGNIFLYESLFELLVMKELMLKGFEFKNVYDCFFFKSSQTTEEEVKEIINKVANNYNHYLISL